MATASEIKLTEAYIGLLGRAPDPAGLAYWVAEYDAAVAAGTDPDIALKKLTNDFTLSDEWDDLGYGTSTTVDGVTTVTFTKTEGDKVVTDMYANLFEKSGVNAPSAADIKYWSDQLQDGSVTASEMVVLLILGAGTTDKATLAIKTEAASYYAENVSQEDYLADKTTAKAAVDSVDGPLSLQSSKDATDSIATGTGVTTALTAADETVTMTGGDDTVTGAVGDSTTYNPGDIINDSSVGDSDTVTITADKDIAFGSIQKVEAVNVNYAEQLGAGMTMTNVDKVVASTINFTAAATVDVVGVTVTGETVVTANGALVSDLNTVGVTSLTATNGLASSVTIAGDDKLAVIQVDDIDANDTIISTASVGTASAATDIDLDGTAEDNDAASVSAVGAVSLDVSDGVLVEEITLSGNGAAVDFALSGGTATDMTYTTAGDQAVTLSAASTELNGATIVNGGTGTLAIDVTGTPGDLDLTGVTLAGGLDISGDTGAAEAVIQVASGTAITVTSNQNAGGTLTFDANDAANDSAITIDLTTNDVSTLKTTDMDKVTISTGDDARTIGAINMGANDAEVAIVGTNDITISNAIATGDLTISGQKVTLTGAGPTAVDADGIFKVTGTNDVTLVATVTADNDVTVESDTAVAFNDITSLKGSITITGDSLDSDDALSAQNDITLTATNDVDLLTMNADKGSVEITGNKITATDLIDGQNDITITGTNDVLVEAVNTSNGSITLAGTSVEATSTLDAATNITLTGSNDAFTGDLDGAITAGGTVSLTDGKFDASTVEIKANKVVISGDTDLLGGKVKAESVLITSTNDVTIDALEELNADEGAVVSGAAATGKINVTVDGDTASTGTITVVTGAGNDTITVTEDTKVNVSSGAGADIISVTDIAAGSVINAEGGDDVVTLTEVTTAYTVVGGEGNDTFDLSGALITSATVDGGDGDADTVKIGGNNVAQTLDLKNIEVIELAAATTMTAASLANDSTFELKGGSTFAVTTANAGETVDLSAVTTNVLAPPTSITITGGTGADIITGALNYANTINGGNGGGTLTGGNGIDGITGGTGIDTINGGGGNDIISALAGADIIDGGDGVDSITGGADADKLTGGSGVDTFVFGNGDSDAADMDVILDYTTAVDKIDNGGTITLAVNNDAAGEATVSATGLVTGYNGAATAYDTLAEKQAQIDKALGGTAQQAAVFTHDGKTYLYISVGTNVANDGTDTFIELTGVTATTGITIAVGDITAIS